MCGIIAVISPQAASKAFEGLKSLEYRGYDSWGLVVPSGPDKPFFLERHVGRIGNSRPFLDNSASIALGHTRWATHGKVEEKNAHPHISNDGKIAIVHNGIVENFSQLKKELISKGFHFNSDTDSEVIANLIEENLKTKSFEDAVRAALLALEGSYAIAAIKAYEKKIVCARNGSPLVLGIGVNEFFAGSDATAFIESTNKAVFLNDSELAVISDKIKVFDVKSGAEKKFTVKELKWTKEQAQKGAFEHFMLKEIFEQPDTILAATEQPQETILEIASMLADPQKKIVLLGCGSSYHACLAGTYFFGKNGLDSRAILASEIISFPCLIDKDTLVIAISQSGETADLIDALKFAKSKKSKIVAIVNVMDSTIMRLADYPVMMNAGPEICVLSTKSYTSQLAILLLLADAASTKERHFERSKEVLRVTAKKIRENLNKFNDTAKFLAKELARSKDIFVIGRGMAFPTALESALKIKEVSYIHAEGFAGAELKHGTIALIEEGTPAIVLSTPESRNLTLSNAIEMKSRGAKIIGISQNESSEYDISITVPRADEADPIMLILPVQLLSYYLALERGCDPDKPRNLSKVVTVR